MARWVAIVALLLGMGFTAFESFSATDGQAPIRSMDGGSSIPPDKLADGGSSIPPNVADPRESDGSAEQ
jgi:hypothetical protein